MCFIKFKFVETFREKATKFKNQDFDSSVLVGQFCFVFFEGFSSD